MPPSDLILSVWDKGEVHKHLVTWVRDDLQPGWIIVRANIWGTGWGHLIVKAEDVMPCQGPALFSL